MIAGAPILRSGCGILQMGMKTKRARTDQAAELIVSVLEQHLDKLTPAERADRIHAFQQVVAKIGAGAKSRVPGAAPANSPATLKRA